MVLIKYAARKSSIVCSKSEQQILYPILDKKLSFWKDGYFFSELYQMNLWDGKVHFFSLKTGKFHSGFLSQVLKIIVSKGLQVDVTGYPESIPGFDTLTEITLMDGPGKTISLYEHQLDGVRKALQYSRGIWEIATNGGKSEVCAGLCKVLGIPPTMYIIPRQVLLKQTAARLEKRLGVQVGMVGGGINKPNPNGITVVMFQTGARLLKKHKNKLAWVTDAKVILGDECHFLTDARYQALLDASTAKIRILMSGTKSRKDPVAKGTAIAYGGPTLAKINNDDLIELGISAKPNVLYIEPKVNVVDKYNLLKLEYYEALQNCQERHKQIAALARAFYADDNQTVIMVAKTEHGRAISKFLPEATFTHGSAPNRKDTERRLQAGETFMCITTPIFDTGFDVPNIRCIIYAGGGSDEIRLAQSLGRLVRQNETKDKVIWFIDFMDTFHPVLKKHSRSRERYFKKHKSFTMTENLSLLPPRVYTRYMKEITGLKGIT